MACSVAHSPSDPKTCACGGFTVSGKLRGGIQSRHDRSGRARQPRLGTLVWTRAVPGTPEPPSARPSAILCGGMLACTMAAKQHGRVYARTACLSWYGDGKPTRKQHHLVKCRATWGKGSRPGCRQSQERRGGPSHVSGAQYSTGPPPCEACRLLCVHDLSRQPNIDEARPHRWIYGDKPRC